MGRRKYNARRIVYTRAMSIATSKPLLQIVDAPGYIRVMRERYYDPSIGRLRAWAEPLTGGSLAIGLCY